MAIKHKDIWTAVAAPFIEKFGLMRSGDTAAFDRNYPAGWYLQWDDQNAASQNVVGVDSSTGATKFSNANGNVFTTSVSFSAGTLAASSATGITAHAGGGQTSATALTANNNNVTVVGSTADSVKLPVAAVGLTIRVSNAARVALQIFGAGTATINGIATATGVSQGAGTTVDYTCYVAGNWISNAVVQAASASAVATNFQGTETGVNNAIVAALLDGSGAAISLAAGLEIRLTLAHTLQIGANTLALNGGAAKAIGKATAPGVNLAVGFASGSIITMIYDGTQWQVTGT